MTDTDQASELWKQGRPLDAGRVVFEGLPKQARPAWAADILRTVIGRVGTISAPIENVLKTANTRDAWPSAHAAFVEIRHVVLKLEEQASHLPDQKLLLAVMLLAELVAKVVYNATDPQDEFDEDTGWWILVCLKDVLDLLKDPDFSAQVLSGLKLDPD
jgi:hypothetical protein